MGAELLVMPCNGAHAFAAEIEGAVSVPLVSWIEETVAHLASLRPRPRRVGLLATDGTLASGIYQAALRAAGIEAVVPEEREQKRVMAAVYAVKGGAVRPPDVHDVVDRLVARGADAVVLACTELPELGLVHERVPVVDPASVLAARVVALAGGRPREAA
jgi:aspartate racemase